jgi:hypothetical protein
MGEKHIKKMNTKLNKGTSIILYITVLILLSPLVSSLGLIPASETILLGSDKNIFEINIMNADNKDYELQIDVQGELSNYITIDKKNLILRSDTNRETIKVTVNIPENHNLVPGEYITRIIINDKETGQGEVSAKISLSFRLTIMIPYSGSFIDATLYAPNFDKTRGGNFVIQAQNIGSQNAVNVVPVIDIYSSTNKRITTLRGEGKLIRVGETINFALPLNDNLENGKYFAKTSFIFEGESRNDEKIFTVGSPEIIIDSISTLSFKLGGIAGFDIFLLNEWGEEIRGVYANVEFKKENELLESVTTAMVNIPGMEHSRLQAFWDTKRMNAGSYDLIINLFYLDKTKSEKHQIVLETNNIRIVGTGRVIEKSEEKDNTGILILVIFFMVILNSLLIYKFVIKKKPKQK